MITETNYLFWKPRVLAAIYITILSFFALEVLTYKYPFSEMVTAFFLRLIPALIILFFLILAWKWEEIGGFLFLLLGLILLFQFNSEYAITNFLIAAPLLLIGTLFLANSLVGNKHKHLKEKILRLEKEIQKDVKIIEAKAKSALKGKVTAPVKVEKRKSMKNIPTPKKNGKKKNKKKAKTKAKSKRKTKKKK